MGIPTQTSMNALQAFPSFCTVCDIQLDNSCASQIYCSEQCRLKDSSPTLSEASSIPPHWYDSFNNVEVEPEPNAFGSNEISPISTRLSSFSLRDSSSPRGSMSSYSSNGPNGKRSSVYSPLSPWCETDRHVLPNELLSSTKHQRNSCTASPLTDMFGFENNHFEPPNVSDAETSASSPPRRRHSLYIKSGLQLYTANSSRRTSLQEPYEGTSTTSYTDLTLSPLDSKSIGLVLPPPPVRKSIVTLTYEMPKLKISED